MIDLIQSLVSQYQDWYLGIAFIWFLAFLDEFYFIDVIFCIMESLLWPLAFAVRFVRYMRSC